MIGMIGDASALDASMLAVLNNDQTFARRTPGSIFMQFATGGGGGASAVSATNPNLNMKDPNVYGPPPSSDGPPVALIAAGVIAVGVAGFLFMKMRKR